MSSQAAVQHKAAAANRNKSREKLNLFGTSAELIQLRVGEGVGGGRVAVKLISLESDVFESSTTTLNTSIRQSEDGGM